MSHPPQRAISFQDTSYGRRSCGRPKSGNIAVLSPHRPRIGPHAPKDLTTVILGFADRGSPDLAASVVVLRREGLNANLYYRWSKEFLEAGKKRLVGDTTREADLSAYGPPGGARRTAFVGSLAYVASGLSPATGGQGISGTSCGLMEVAAVRVGQADPSKCPRGG